LTQLRKVSFGKEAAQNKTVFQAKVSVQILASFIFQMSKNICTKITAKNGKIEEVKHLVIFIETFSCRFLFSALNRLSTGPRPS
jgi:hypothetical protein